MKITITKPARKPVAVGAEGGEDKPERLEGGDAPSGSDGSSGAAGRARGPARRPGRPAGARGRGRVPHS